MIPVTVLTGFLGSGKTTLLAQWLKQAAFARTAVIINEFGEIGLDHDLIESSDESFVTLTTGCLCCAIRDDLILTLEELLQRQQDFERVVIETSGLADPAPILQALMRDSAIAACFYIEHVITTVDAVTGRQTLGIQTEAVKQVVVADRLVLTKTDLLKEPNEGLHTVLTDINASASVFLSRQGQLDPVQLFAGANYYLQQQDGLQDWLVAAEHQHNGQIQTFTLIRQQPVAAVTLSLFLEALADHCGSNLLRLKGIVNIAENPDQPAVIHGVQHVFHAPVWLPVWPSDDHSTRMVFISRGIAKDWVMSLFNAIDREVFAVNSAHT